MIGFYRGTFVGPGWLRAAGNPALTIGGLGGWWGKKFEVDGSAVNLVLQAGELEARLPMRLTSGSSALDGKPALALIYAADSRFPWPHIVDELRQLERDSFLGMTYVNFGVLRKLAFPFLLEAQEHVNGL